jgi:N-acetylneuraminic acid mutarotase
MKLPKNSIQLPLLIATLAFSFSGVTQAEEIPSSVLTNLSSTTLSGYVDTTVSWYVDGLPAQVPPIIHFQGFVTVNGSGFDGLGEFKFSLVNSNGALTFWSNDGSAAGGAEPASAVPVLVNKGIYSVNLGDSQLPNMTPIPPTIFTNSDVRLRVWFSDGKHGFEQLSPDQRITSVGYAMMAANVPNGSITSQKLAADAVTGANIAAGSIGANQLASGAVGASQLAAGAALANLMGSGQSGVASGGIVLSFDANSTSLANAGYVKVGTLPISQETWAARSSLPSPRWSHTAVWTGSEMLIWGGGAAGSFLNDGGRYNPATDTWLPIPIVGAPSGRWFHSAVWTGNEMVVWGGRNDFFSSTGNMNDGGRYDPAANSWKPVNQTGAPSGRSQFPSIWTGSEMLVWGGAGDDGQNRGDGARYNPSTDAWTPIAMNGAPQGRVDHAAVWMGTEMFLWGGGTFDGTYFDDSLNTGGRYDPAADKWRTITTVGAPPAAAQAVAAWTGREIIVWGGQEYKTGATTNTGGRYDPVLDSWRSTSLIGAPTDREYQTGVWTGREFVIWGGVSKGDRAGGSYSIMNTGARYDPKTDAWAALSRLNAPSPRLGHTAVWTGQGMLIFGGYANGAGEFNSNYFWTPPSLFYLYQLQ